MSQQPASADPASSGPRWLALLFTCFGRQDPSNKLKDTEGIERQLPVSHDQPHLISPMKLVLYDEMPKSPSQRPGSVWQVSQWVSQGKDLASKASDQASITIKKKLSKQSISVPVLKGEAEPVPVIKRLSRLLQLSVYLPGNRLSDLPEFDRVDFTSTGEIRLPPKSQHRVRAGDMRESFSRPLARPAVSMCGERQLDYWQQRAASLDSHSHRSAFEGLNSHPVELPTNPPRGPTPKVLSPMIEEAGSNAASPSTLNGSMIHEAVPVRVEQQTRPSSASLPPNGIKIPYKKPIRSISSTNPATRPLTSHCPNSSRISHWLSRTRSCKTVSSDTNTTRTAQFYQHAISPPAAHHHHHQNNSQQQPIKYSRSYSPTSKLTRSSSSISSPPSSTNTTSDVDTDADDPPSMTRSNSSPSSSSSSRARSRSGTLRSISKQVTVVQEEVEGGSKPAFPDNDDDAYAGDHLRRFVHEKRQGRGPEEMTGGGHGFDNVL